MQLIYWLASDPSWLTALCARFESKTLCQGVAVAGIDGPVRKILSIRSKSFYAITKEGALERCLPAEGCVEESPPELDQKPLIDFYSPFPNYLLQGCALFEDGALQCFTKGTPAFSAPGPFVELVGYCARTATGEVSCENSNNSGIVQITFPAGQSCKSLGQNFCVSPDGKVIRNVSASTTWEYLATEPPPAPLASCIDYGNGTCSEIWDFTEATIDDYKNLCLEETQDAASFEVGAGCSDRMTVAQHGVCKGQDFNVKGKKLVGAAYLYGNISCGAWKQACSSAGGVPGQCWGID